MVLLTRLHALACTASRLSDSYYICTTYCTNCAFTHDSPELKSVTTFTWLPPTEEPGTGDIALHLTIVRSFNQIFTQVIRLSEAQGTDPPDVMIAPYVLNSQPNAAVAGSWDITVG